MFTGLVEQTAKVKSLKNETGMTVLTVARTSPDEFTVALGDSVAVNGCCLTATRFTQNELVFDVGHETLARTHFKDLKVGDLVNLERAMRLSDRLGGHLVSGHVDTLAAVVGVEKNANGWTVKIAVPRRYAAYVIEKGSVCLSGVSLTINEVKDSAEACTLTLMLIPTTLAKTNLSNLTVKQNLNVEFDQVAKYLERFASVSSQKF